MRILITGANGFVGFRLIGGLISCGYPSSEISAAVRQKEKYQPIDNERVVASNLLPDFDWFKAVDGVDVVVHCAARVHVMHDAAADPLEAYRLVNVHGTLNLALQSAIAGVRRFVFVSSIKVNGEFTRPGQEFCADDEPMPLDPYGVSKFEAEQGLRRIAAQTGMELVIVRPPLVYGPGVKANFASMVSWVARGIPLPLGAINNVRSMVALDNLVDLLISCLDHPKAAGQIFLVSDDDDVSTSNLLRRIASSLNRRAFLIPIPAGLLLSGAALVGRRALMQRLCGNLQVDIEKTRNVLGWSPPLTLDQGLYITTEGMNL